VSANATAGIRTLAFGHLEAGLWGCLWGAQQPVAVIGGLGRDSSPHSGPVTIDGASENEDWRIAARAWGSAGDQLELIVSAAGTPASGGSLPGFEQLCHVTGRCVLGGSEQAVDSLGLRALRDALDLGRLDSVREVFAWFEPDEGLSLTALRPRGARGHDADTVAATVFEPEGPTAVEDPRLSTTYGRDGLPVHAGMELWLPADDEHEQYPRRAAGDALGESVRLRHAGLALDASPLRWYSRGLEGAGVYLLVRPE
jgi:hypothetical protein